MGLFFLIFSSKIWTGPLDIIYSAASHRLTKNLIYWQVFWYFERWTAIIISSTLVHSGLLYGEYEPLEPLPGSRVDHGWKHKVMVFRPLYNCDSLWLIISSSIMFQCNREIDLRAFSTPLIFHNFVSQKWEVSVEIDLSLIVSAENPADFFAIYTWRLSFDITIRVQARFRKYS